MEFWAYGRDGHPTARELQLFVLEVRRDWGREGGREGRKEGRNKQWEAVQINIAQTTIRGSHKI